MCVGIYVPAKSPFPRNSDTIATAVARNDRTIRLEVLKRALMQTRRGVALKPLADKHGWKLRNLYRDIDVLEAALFPIHCENGLYRMDNSEPCVAGSPSPDERLALFLAREQAAGWKYTSLGRALDKLWHRIATSADGQTALFPVDNAPWLTTREWRPIDYGRHAKIVWTLERATRERIVIQTRYRAASTRQITSRAIEPGQLHWDPGLETLYLIGYCRLRADVRVFAVHRFLAVAPTEQTFAPRPGNQSRVALDKAFRVWRSDHIEHVRIRFDADIADEIRERRWLANQEISEEHGSVILTGDVAGLPEIERWLLGYGGAAEVLEPKALRESVAAKLRAGAEGYGENRLSRTDKGEA
jgi:predicted DNA-binding transcriptional regulator YafY